VLPGLLVSDSAEHRHGVRTCRMMPSVIPVLPARPPRRARADLAARRAAGLWGDRRGHRAPGRGTRAPDPGHHP